MSKKITTVSFIAKAREIHCDRYSYDKTVSVSEKKNVIGTCPTHGDFNTYPSNHTHKSQPKGCWDCGGPKSLTWEKFVFAQSQKLRAGGSVFSEQAISTFTLGFTSQPTASVQASMIQCYDNRLFSNLRCCPIHTYRTCICSTSEDTLECSSHH